MLQKLQINPRYTAHTKKHGDEKKNGKNQKHIAHLQFDEKRSKAGKPLRME